MDLKKISSIFWKIKFYIIRKILRISPPHLVGGERARLFWPGLNKIWDLTDDGLENGSKWEKNFPISQSDNEINKFEEMK
jgi:hypothetical protein